MEHRDRIEGWLTQKRPLRLTKVHTLLARDYGVEVSYATLRRFAIDELGFGQRKPTVRVADAPAGEEAQVDFGKMGELYDAVAGRMRALYVLVVTLSFSRYQFVWPTYEQTTTAVCEGLDEAWLFFGGVVARIVPDNASSMVSKADPLAPRIVDAFADYAQARGLFVDTARVRQPRDKGRVENQIAYVRESWFAGEKFDDLEHARHAAAKWCHDVAGTRVHGTTRAVPLEVFEGEEKHLLRPAPAERFDVPHWRARSGLPRRRAAPSLSVRRSVLRLATDGTYTWQLERFDVPHWRGLPRRRAAHGLEVPASPTPRHRDRAARHP